RRTRLAVSLKRNNEHASLNRQLIEANNPSRYRHVLSGNADVAAADLPITNQSTRHELRRIDRRRKTDPLRRKYRGRVHADHFAAGVDERPARIPRIERGISLDNAIHQPARLRPQRTSECTHDARGHRVLKPKRISDRDHELANTNRL